MEYLTLGILAHVDAGKTTLCERLLYHNGVISKFSRVDKGESFLDYNALERKRGITIYAKEAIIKNDAKEITLLDTPGHIDFVWDTLSAISALDAALLVVDASSSISIHAKRLYSLLQKNHIPAIIFFNKMDLAFSAKSNMLEEISKLNANPLDFTEEKSILFDSLAMCDEGLLDEFLASGEISKESIKNAFCDCLFTPVFFGEAINGNGIEELNEAIFDLISIRKDCEDDFLAYKIVYDEKGNRLTYGRVNKEYIEVKDSIYEEKIDEIRRYNGVRFEQIQKATNGMIVALKGPRDLTLNPKGVGAYTPLLEYEMVIEDGRDRIDVFKQLTPLIDENPSLHFRVDSVMQRILLSPMGKVQLEILKSVISDRFNMEVEFTEAGVVYKESVEGLSEGIGHFEPLRHYAEVHLILEPNPGRGIEAESRLSADRLSINFQNQIISTILSLPIRGTIIGAELTDVKFVISDGKAHEKHTEGGDFREATIRAVRCGIKRGEPIILEPLYAFEIVGPLDPIGKIMNRLEQMEADFSPPVIQGDSSSITGRFPVLKLSDFTVFVATVSKGECELSLSFGGYQKVEDVSAIIESSTYDYRRDMEYPADSVFTSHGVGVIIPWEEIEEHMHLPLYSNSDEDDTESERELSIRSQTEISIGTEEIDRIIKAAGGSNKKASPIDRRSHWNRYNSKEKIDATSSKMQSKNKPINDPNAKEYLLVDGYNIVFAWEELKDLSDINIDSAKDTLVDILSEYAAYTEKNVILVFDAYKVSGAVGSVVRTKGIDVVYTKEAQTADAYIEKVSKTLAKDYRVKVATSDRLEQMIVWGDGAIPMSARGLYEEIERTKLEWREHTLTKETKTIQ